jgi:adenosyl cobinamide kinase/adenosyl cobinamide phosphate guanylyltransferase
MVSARNLNANFAAVITLVLGGARSGKSRIAEELAARHAAPVTYIATATITDDDDLDLMGRVVAHRDRRPSDWKTIEAGTDLVPALERAKGATVLIDSLGTWVAGHDEFTVDIDGLVAALTRRGDDTVVVSEEVGLGVHPSTEAGRQFRDALGDVNQAVAAIADEVLLVVAGRVLRL